MLEPTSRRLLLDALRPPEGYRFDACIATTFTLDLVTLLTVPLALHLYDAEDEQGRPVLDPVAMLDAIRQTAGKLTVFCQAGRISVPSAGQRLFAFLEDAVVEVKALRPTGLFHPKVWVLRLTGDASIAYRLLVASRNLTADRSWDVLLCLDGMLTDRKLAIAANHPLADFVAALPGLALRDVGQAVHERAKLFADELRRVSFDPPDGFDEIRFWPMGIARARNPFEAGTRRRLVISPFLSDDALLRLTEDGADHVLVSRPESLAACAPATLARFRESYALAPTADAELAADAEGALTGLHAKVVVGDDGWDASVWVGSANATKAGLDTNVEFMAELRGRKSAAGVEATLDALRSLLVPFTHPGTPPEDTDPDGLARIQEDARAQLAVQPLLVRVTSGAEGALGMDLVVPEGAVALDDRAAVSAWPISVPQETHAQRLESGGGTVAAFGPLSVESVTPFFAFEIAVEGGPFPLRFVRALPLEGAPADRIQRILRAVLENRDQVLRLLLLILSGEQLVPAAFATSGDGASAVGSWLGGSSTVLEALLTSLHEAPSRLDRVSAIVADLRGTAEGRQLLPEGFERIWEPIWQARRELNP